MTSIYGPEWGIQGRFFFGTSLRMRSLANNKRRSALDDLAGLSFKLQKKLFTILVLYKMIGGTEKDPKGQPAWQ